MIRKICYLCLVLFLFSYGYIYSNEETQTLENDISRYHVNAFKLIFEKRHINNFLQFGIGSDTLFFLNHCDHVTSIDFDADISDHKNFYDHKQQLKDYDNWDAFLYEYASNINFLDKTDKDKDYDLSVLDNSAVANLKKMTHTLLQYSSFDCAFVDLSILILGDLVNELFGSVPIIIANDTNHSHPIYGWNKINTPANYTRIHFGYGNGTTVWIHNQEKELIEKLQGENWKFSKKMRIFMPNINDEITKSFAMAFQYLGHTLVLPGYSFDKNNETEGLFISKMEGVDNYFHKEEFLRPSWLKDNVEVIETDEIIIHPPDAFVINSIYQENDILNVWQKILKNTTKKPKLIHYSEDRKPPYIPEYMKNLLMIDSIITKEISDIPNIVCWFPWIDYSTFHFAAFSDSHIINTFSVKSTIDDSNAYNKYTTKYIHINAIDDMDFEIKEKGAFSDFYSQLSSSCATLQFKIPEVFDYSLVQSIASGRPIFIKRSSSLVNILSDMFIDERTVFFFDTYEEFDKKISKYVRDEDFRHRKQKEAALVIRELVNNESQALNLDNFLQELIPN